MVRLAASESARRYSTYCMYSTYCIPLLYV